MADVPKEAQRLQDEGRAAGGAGNTVRALESFARANELAPSWPYPPYDMAFTYLLADRIDLAEQWYAEVDRLAPRGFMTAKTSLHMIRRERCGELPDGFSKAFILLEWAEPHDRHAALASITERFPSFAPGWKELASLLEDDDHRLAAFERALAANPDDETYGIVVLNLALLLDRRGEKARARKLVEDLLADPRCTFAAESMAKLTLPQLT